MKKQFVKGLLATALTLLALGGCTESEDSSTTSKSSTSTTLNSSKSSSLKEENIKDSSNTSATTVTPLSAKSWIEQFKNPLQETKPLTRWWVPGSHMNKEEVKKEIESMVAAGFGGAEIVPVSIAGGDGEGEIDWGSDQWKEITKYILEVAGENNFTIDFTLTPAWPLALPTIEDVDDPKQGAQMEMDGAWVDGITKDNSFHGELPISTEAIEDAQKVNGRVELVGITVAKYQDKENKVLDYNSAKTIEATKNEDGTYTTEFTPTEDGEYVLYAWYQHPSGNQKYGNNQVDHYSKYGAQMIIDYWEDVLIPYYGDDWKNVRSLFVDSLEFETHLDWTYDLQKQFEEMYGYDITPYLPAIYDSSDEMSAIGNYMGDPMPFDKNSTQVTSSPA